MDHFKILKRAFEITRHYRALWVFGILLALTTGSRGESNVNWTLDRGSPGNGGNWPWDGSRMPEFGPLPQGWESGLITGAIVLACLALLIGVIFVILRYVSETALVRMVDQNETTGERLGVRQGFRLGWNRAAFRIFLVDLLFGVGLMLAFLLLLAIAAAPLLVWLTDSQAAQVIGSITAAGLILLVILAAIVVAIALSLAIQFIRRAAILEGLGVFDAIRRGFQLMRSRLGDILVMGIILFALGLALVVVMIPLVIALILAAVVLGGLPGLLAGWITSLFAEGALPFIVGAAFGVPVFLAVLIAPIVFISGLAEVYMSSTWTLTYREVIALQAIAPETGV